MNLVKGRPETNEGRLAKEMRVYDLLDSLHIPYERVDHEAAETMEACAEIDKALAPAVICKNLFLCNSQKTKFYLLMIPGTKNPTLPIIDQVVHNDYLSLYQGLIEERRMFHYPPFFHLINVFIKRMVVLESLPDGILYSNLLLKMYLMSLKDNGILLLHEGLPHTAQTIATFTRHQIGTVERALRIFTELGLVESLTNGAYYMPDIQLLVGKSSTEAERKRRERLRLQKQHLLLAGKADICPPENRDKEIREQKRARTNIRTYEVKEEDAV